MKIKSFFAAAGAPALAIIAITNIASAAVLAGWDVNGIELDGSTAPNSAPYTLGATLGTNIASADLTLSSTVNPTTTADQYGVKIFGIDEQVTLAGAITVDHYIQFTIAASTNFILNLTSIEMNGQSSSTGANSAAFMSSVAGFTDGNELGLVTGVAGNIGGFDTDASGFGAPIDLSGAAYQGISSVTFRFYGWDTTSGSGITYIRSLTGDDLVINGTVAAVPEPSAALFGAIGALAFLLRRR